MKPPRGDWSKVREEDAARHNANGDKPPDWEKLDSRRFDRSRLHDKPSTILTLSGHQISTPGNLTSLFAQSKAGKTAVIGGIIGSIISSGGAGDFLGWSAALNALGHAVIHFDTEQSPYDHEQVILTALKRAGMTEEPSWLRSYCLTDVDVIERMEFVAHEMKRAQEECGGIFSVFLDGVGDLMLDTNSLEESSRLTTNLHALAIKFTTVIVPVLHENPDSTGNANSKGRGHIGSYLERKSEAVIRLVKDKDEVTNQFSGKCRHASIPEARGVRFSYDMLKEMHASIGEVKEKAKEKDRIVVAEVFKGQIGGLTWTDCHKRIEEIEGIKRSGSRKRFDRYLDLELIVKNHHDSELYVECHGR